jgi:transposase
MSGSAPVACRGICSVWRVRLDQRAMCRPLERREPEEGADGSQAELHVSALAPRFVSRSVRNAPMNGHPNRRVVSADGGLRSRACANVNSSRNVSLYDAIVLALTLRWRRCRQTRGPHRSSPKGYAGRHLLEKGPLAVATRSRRITLCRLAMPKSYSADLRRRVIEAVEAGASRPEAAESFGIDVSSAVRWLQCWNETGRCAPKPRGGSVSPLERHAEQILAPIAEQSDLTLEETIAELRKRRIRTSKSAASRFSQRHDITFKKESAGGGTASRRRGPGAPALDPRARHV